MNDIANLCELVGADIQDVAKGMSYVNGKGAITYVANLEGALEVANVCFIFTE